MPFSRESQRTAAESSSFIWRYPLILGTVFSFLLFASVVQLSVNERERDFTVAAEGAALDFREHLEESENVINNIVLFFNASSHVTEEEFSLFAGSQFNTHLDIKAVYFLAYADGESRYAKLVGELPTTVEAAGGYQLRALYSFIDQENPYTALSWEAWNEPRALRSINQALEQKQVAMGGVVTLDDGSMALMRYKGVYAGDSDTLLGVVAVMFRPVDVLRHIADDYRLNTAVRVGEQRTGVAHCCRVEGELLLPTFNSIKRFDYRGMPFQLSFSKGVGWEDVYMKVAVLAFVIGALLVVVMRRLRLANMARTQMLMERNRIIKRQVEEQTRAQRQANIELAQQKAALDEHAIVSIADTSGNITYVNEKFCEISGYHSDELVGRNHRIVKSDVHPHEFYQDMWNTISQGKVWHGEVCNRSKSGKEYWVNSTIVPFLDERGLPYQYVSIRTDITAMKAAKLAVTAQEGELNTILNSMPLLIWYKDMDSNIVRANKAAAALVGVTPEEMVGRPHTDFFPEEKINKFRQDDLKVLESGEALINEKESLDIDGTPHHFRVDRVPYRDETGDVIGLIVLATDITRQEEAEQSLLINEERLRRSQVFANIGTWDWNIQTGDLYWSERIAPLFGYEVGELETTYDNFLNAVHPDDRDAVVAAVGACVESGAEYNIEHRVVWPDGQVRWVLEKGDVVRGSDGKPTHMLGVVSDIHDRKMAEQALRDSEAELSLSEEKFRNLYEMSPVGIALNEMDGAFVEANQAFLDIVGYSAEECRALTYWELTPEEYEAQEAEQLESLKASGSYGPYQKEYIHKNGHRVDVLLNGTTIRDRNGNRRIWSIVQDITELNRAEAELRASEERLLEAQRLARVGNWEADMVTGSLKWSDVIYEIFGYAPQSFEPSIEAFKSAIHPNDIATVEESERRAEETGTHDVTHRIVRPDGEVRFVHELARSEFDDEGRLLRLVGTVQDVTEVKLAEQDLAIYQRIFDSSKQGMGVTDAEGMLILSNRAHDELLGRTHEEVVGQQFLSFLSDETREWIARDVFAKPQKEGGWAGLIPIKHKDGHEVITASNIGFIFDDDENLQNVFNILSDYTPELERQEVLRQAKEAAEEGSRAKSEFLSSMSHELRTPLNAILGFAQLMTDDENLTVEQRDSLNDISNAGSHLLELINEVLDLAKIEAGKVELSIDSVAVTDVMEVCENLITPTAERYQIGVNFNASCYAEHYVRADFTRTKQILLNLLSNAVKYNREGGRVDIDCTDQGNGFLRISVTDTGSGIPTVKLPGLFEAFNRLSAESSGVEGTGIGLLITRQLLELMGGEIGVESEVGKGSTFWFELPVAKASTTRKKRIPDHSVGDTYLGLDRSVLYIEDNPVNLKLVTKLIEKRTSLTLLNAEEPIRGMEIAAEKQPDLILLDINLPEMDGYEVLRRLREMPETANIPVVALSANAMESDLRKGEEAGFNGYLTKPIDIKAFFSLLEAFLG